MSVIPTAVWFPGPHQAELRQEPLPQVGPGDLHIRAIASAISHGTEMLVYRGQVPTDLALDLPTFQGSFSFPIKHGYASVGRVVEAGTAVEGFRAGDLVFVHHPHQTEYVIPAAREPRPVLLPPDLDPEIGLFTANLETAVNVMLDASPRLGERIVIFGQGVVGLLLTQLARRSGIETIIAVEPFETRQSLSRTLGADVLLSPGKGLAEEVRQLTQGGADLALEASGNSAALDSAIDCLAFGGTVVVCSWYGTKLVQLQLGGAFHRRRIRIVSSQVGSIDPALQPRWTLARRLDLVRSLLPQLTLAPLITHRIPFHQAPDAYQLLDQHPDQTVQVVLTY